MDKERPSGEDDPEGYFEWQAIKPLPLEPGLVGQAAGMADSRFFRQSEMLLRRRVIGLVKQLDSVLNSGLNEICSNPSSLTHAQLDSP